jgi:hypothetical protein
VRLRRVAVPVAVAGMLAFASPAGAQMPGDPCLSAEVPAAAPAPEPLRFGITPQLAGTVGAGQGEVLPDVRRRRLAALAALRPPRRTLVIRLNRLFMSDGLDGIRRFAHRARVYARRGYAVESQVRYHPSAAQEGDMHAWRRFVRRATRALAANEALVSLTITNEVNLPVSENTSDGAFERAIEAIVDGVVTARRVLDHHRRGDVELGFSYAYRYLPTADAEFWTSLGELATRRFRRGLDYVGVQLYPGLFVPPVLVGETAGGASVEALAIVRECFMPEAALGPATDLWISENGYATNLGHTEERQAAELADTIEALRAYAGALGVRDYRYFNLRDNVPNGTDLFDDVGLLRADYSRKPAFDVYRRLIARLGA